MSQIKPDYHFMLKSWPGRTRCYDCQCTDERLCIVRKSDAPIWKHGKWVYPRTLCKQKGANKFDKTSA